MLSEQYIQDSFHSYLKSSLTQAKVERLLDAELLSSAESDLMITGVLNSNIYIFANRYPDRRRYLQAQLSVFTLQLSDQPQTHLQSLFPAPQSRLQTTHKNSQ
jgi:hypothetical protein